VGTLYEKDLGFQPVGLVTSSVDLTGVGINDPEEAAILLDRIRESVETVPGVSRVSLADGHPVDLVGNFTSVSRLDRPDDPAFKTSVEFTRVGEGYFQTVGTPILRGRVILSTDDPASEPVMVVTQSLASRLWPGVEALGQRVSSRFGRSGPTEFTVVGVVGDVASSRPTEDWANVFVAFRQNPYSRVMVLARSGSDPTGLSRPLREALLSVEPDLPYPVWVHAQSLVDQAGNSQRVSARIAGSLGVLAILLAAIGIYGVVAFAVSRRIREIGLRMAMGAARGAVLREVLRDALVLAVPGLLAGAVLTAIAATGFRAQLYGLSPLDPTSFLGAGSLLLLVTLLAGFFPARRASGIDPMEALRED
jgi:predicted permease